MYSEGKNLTIKQGISSTANPHLNFCNLCISEIKNRLQGFFKMAKDGVQPFPNTGKFGDSSKSDCNDRCVFSLLISQFDFLHPSLLHMD